MKILLCHNFYQITGGAEVFVHETARVLELNGHEVAFLCVSDPDAKSKWSKYFPKRVDFHGNVFKAIIGIKNIIYSKKSKKAAKEIIDAFKPDLVHCFNLNSSLTPSVLDVFNNQKIPVVVSFNDYKHICPNYKLFHHGKICEKCKNGHFINCVLNRCSHDSLIWSVASMLEAEVHKLLDIYKKNTNCFTFASNFMAQKTMEFGWLSDQEWVKLQNPFDSTKYTESGCSDDYILYFGRLVEEKGVDVLLEAMNMCSNIPLKIVGNGPEKDKLEKYVSSQKLNNVTFLGSVWGDDLDLELKRCSFVVVPSIWFENVGYVILQAFAFGKPVIISNKGGMPEFVTYDKTGLIYDASNYKELGEKILSLYSDKNKIKELGHNAKIYADSIFNDKVFYSQLLNAYDRAFNDFSLTRRNSLNE